jgi:hypothetical protein
MENSMAKTKLMMTKRILMTYGSQLCSSLVVFMTPVVEIIGSAGD